MAERVLCTARHDDAGHAAWLFPSLEGLMSQSYRASSKTMVYRIWQNRN